MKKGDGLLFSFFFNVDKHESIIIQLMATEQRIEGGSYGQKCRTQCGPLM